MIPSLAGIIIIDELVKSRHPVESRIGSGTGNGVQVFCNSMKLLDSGFRRNDEKRAFGTFYEPFIIRVQKQQNLCHIPEKDNLSI